VSAVCGEDHDRPPGAGPARRPTSIRAADPALASLIRPAVGAIHSARRQWCVSCVANSEAEPTTLTFILANGAATTPPYPRPRWQGPECVRETKALPLTTLPSLACASRLSPGLRASSVVPQARL
jgi:hypothetical protein